jgi:hypothetical protein
VADLPKRKIGELLDSLGVLAELDDDDMVPAALVLLKVVDGHGGVSLCVAQSDGLSWLDQLGLLAAADAVTKQDGYRQRDEEG